MDEPKFLQLENSVRTYTLRMEKGARERLLDAGLELLGTVGARAATARAVEAEAGVPHGSLRHHFGNQARYMLALVEHLLLVDAPVQGESLQATVQRWLTTQRTATRARYELALMGQRDTAIGEAMVNARDKYVAHLVQQGISAGVASALVAALDGLVLDSLMRDTNEISLAALTEAGQVLASVTHT